MAKLLIPRLPLPPRNLAGLGRWTTDLRTALMNWAAHIAPTQNVVWEQVFEYEFGASASAPTLMVPDLGGLASVWVKVYNVAIDSGSASLRLRLGEGVSLWDGANDYWVDQAVIDHINLRDGVTDLLATFGSLVITDFNVRRPKFTLGMGDFLAANGTVVPREEAADTLTLYTSGGEDMDGGRVEVWGRSSESGF